MLKLISTWKITWYFQPKTGVIKILFPTWWNLFINQNRLKRTYFGSDYRKNLMKKQTKHLGWSSQMQSCRSHHNVVVLSTVFLYSLNRNASIQEFAPDWLRYPYITQVIQEELPGITLREIPLLLSLHKWNFKYLEKTLSPKQKRGPKHQNDR